MYYTLRIFIFFSHFCDKRHSELTLQQQLSHLESIFSIDCVIFGYDQGDLKILLIERNQEPFKDWFALPGYFVEPQESIEHAAERILNNFTGLTNIYLEQFYTFGAVDRHPQGRLITVAYYALIKLHKALALQPHTNYVKQALWYSVKDLPNLAFDHKQIVETSIQKIRKDLADSPIAFELLPDKFTLTQLQGVYEAILNKKLDKRNFRKKIINSGILKELNEKQQGVAYRAATLYRLDKRKYREVFRKDLSFSKET